MPPLNPNSTLARAEAREKVYKPFARRIAEAAPETEAPAPIDPAARITAETIQMLAEFGEHLVNAQASVIARLPEAARLKLSLLLLTAADAAEAALVTFRRYAATGTLEPPRQARGPQKKRRFKL